MSTFGPSPSKQPHVPPVAEVPLAKLEVEMLIDPAAASLNSQLPKIDRSLTIEKNQIIAPEKSDGILRTAWRLAKTVFTEMSKLAIAKSMAIVAEAGANFSLLLYSGKLIDAISQQSPQAYKYIIAIGVLGIVSHLAKVSSDFITTIMNRRVEKLLEVKLLTAVSGYQIIDFEDDKFRGKVAKVNENSSRFPECINRLFSTGGYIANLGLAAAALGMQQPLVAILLTAITVPRLLAERAYAKDVNKLEGDVAEDRRKYWYLNWNLTYEPSFRELKLFQHTKAFIERIAGIFDKINQQVEGVERKNFIRSLGVGLADNLAVTGAVSYFAYQAVTGGLSIGGVVFLISAIYQFTEAVKSLSDQVGAQIQDHPFIADYFKLQDENPSSIKRQYRKINWETPPEIKFENVSFTYPGAESPSIKNLNLTIPAGAYVGIVGGSGNGKTTLIKLLIGIYQPTEGNITYNDCPLSEIDPADLLEHLAVLNQDAEKYEGGTVKESVEIGTSAENPLGSYLDSALYHSGSQSVVGNLKSGADTILGTGFKDGVGLSGGEFQRLATARVFMKPGAAKLLVLDEPTSNLDVDAENFLVDQLVSNPATRIMISHRYSTLKAAQLILVLDRGEILESGSHQQLIDKGGIYAQQYRKQVSSFE